METPNEYERGAMGATHSASQRAAFDDIVKAWADGTVPLAESAAALRSKMAKLPVLAKPTTRRAKAVTGAEPPSTLAQDPTPLS